MRAEGLDGLAGSPGRVRLALHRARAALDARRGGAGSQRPASPGRRGAPGGTGRPAQIDLRSGSLHGATVVVVDDGTSPVGIIRAGVDLVRMGGAGCVIVAVACGPAEILDEIGRWAGDVCAGLVPSWTEWYRWGGHIYDEDVLPERALPDRSVPEAGPARDIAGTPAGS